MKFALTGDSLVPALWAIVLIEIVSPIPLFLSLGAVYVLLAKPPWFERMVRELYGTR